MCTYGIYRINKSYFIFHTGNNTVAVIKGHESYDLPNTSCKNVFGYINKLLDDGKISTGGKNIPVKILLGGDYKEYGVIIQCSNCAHVMRGGHIKKRSNRFTAMATLFHKG